MKFVSTSALAKEKDIDSKDLFRTLKDKGWIYKKEEQWHLTKEGRIAGGDTKYNPKFGEYVVWPLNLDVEQQVDSKSMMNATKIGEHFNISNKKVNLYLSDLGWISKDRGGWELSKAGKKNGGHQMEAQNGTPYSLWESSILTNVHFIRTLDIGEGNYEETQVKTKESEAFDDFRKKYPAEKRTSDGHYVRSRAELLIDNFFYRNGIVHAYEKKVNIDEPMYCDFYLPEKKIWVEFWGLEENAQYAERKKKKLELYAKYGLTLIELKDADLENLDEVLEAKLRRLGITV